MYMTRDSTYHFRALIHFMETADTIFMGDGSIGDISGQSAGNQSSNAIELTDP